MPAPRKPNKSGDESETATRVATRVMSVRVAAGTNVLTAAAESARLFLDYVTRRWEGSPPPSAEAYAQAERLWRQLPGAVITLPTDLGGPPEQPPPGDGDGGQRGGQES